MHKIRHLVINCPFLHKNGINSSAITRANVPPLNTFSYAEYIRI